MSPRDLSVGDLVVVAVTVERVRSPEMRVSRAVTPWLTWEAHFRLERIILLRSVFEGPATVIDFPGMPL